MASGCKVDRVMEGYGLVSADPVYDTLDEGLLARWTGAGERSAMGYRSLTEWFNKRLLTRVYDEHGRETLGARLDSDYEIMQDADDLVGAELIESLRADGIDGERLRSDLVSWGTMRTHLQECLDGHKEDEPARTDWEAASVEKAVDVAAEKTATAISALAAKGELAGGDTAGIEVQIQLSCEACPTRVPLDVAVDRGYVCAEHATQHSAPENA